MRKFFITLGVIFLVLIVLGAIGFGYIAFRGNTLDKESKAYVDAAIPVIVTNWNKKELLDRASPEFKKAVSDAQIDQLFHQFTSLGPVHDLRLGHRTGAHVSEPSNWQNHNCRLPGESLFRKGRRDDQR